MRRNLALGLTGGVLYYLAECLWRGHSHPSMLLCGGACFVLIGGLNEWLPWEMPLLLQMLLGAAIVTALELLTGCVVNDWLRWRWYGEERPRYRLW